MPAPAAREKIAPVRPGQEQRVTLAQSIPHLITLSMSGLLLSVGLRTDLPDLLTLLRRPGLLLRSIVAMKIVMPLFAVGAALAFDLNHAVEGALIALALSPVPPMLPEKGLKAGGTRGYVVGLLFVASLVSIVFVPVAAHLVGRLFNHAVDVTAGGVARIVVVWMLVPLLAGSLVRAAAPRLALRVAGPLATVSNVLVLAAVPVLVEAWPQMMTLVGHFSVLAIVAFVLVGLAVGHLMGGPKPGDRTVLALAVATRHPAVALAILHLDADRRSAAAAVLLVMLLSALTAIPYLRWRSHA